MGNCFGNDETNYAGLDSIADLIAAENIPTKAPSEQVPNIVRNRRGMQTARDVSKKSSTEVPGKGPDIQPTKEPEKAKEPGKDPLQEKSTPSKVPPPINEAPRDVQMDVQMDMPPQQVGVKS